MNSPAPTPAKASIGTLRALWPFVRKHRGLFIAWLAALVKRLPLPDNLAALGVPQESIPALSAAAQNVKRLMNNAPCSVSREEIAAIYQTLYPEHT